MRSLILALLALALSAPTAHAALGDGYIPDSQPGVNVITGKRGPVLHFGPKAAKLYDQLGGRRVTMSCGFVEDDDGWYGIRSGVSSSDILPRRRSGVPVSTNVDLCALSTKRGAKERGPCLQPAVSEKQCIRVVVALTDAGRTYLDQKKRAIELFIVLTTHSVLEADDRLSELPKALGSDAVELPSADASPPAGKVGYFNGPGHDIVTAALLANGERVFLSLQGRVFSTNVPDLMGPNESAFELL